MEYIKDFDGWNKVKKIIDKNNRELTFNEKEIWWCNLGLNIGSEQDGKGKFSVRPIYILKKISSKTFLCIPLTSKLKDDYAHVAFYFNYNLNTATLSQIKVLDKKRLIKIMGVTSDYLHNKMKKATIAFILS